jgi:hypothetical protein
VIVWEGNKKEFGTSHQSPSVPQNALKIRDAEGFIGKALPFGIAPMLICMVAVFLKAFINKEPPISPIFLIPAFLGIIPLIGVILIPISMKPLLTICIVSAFMGLISPAPDYMDVISVLRKAPKGAVICDSQAGLYAYIK